MRVYLLNLLATIRASYWFIPSLMMVGAILLSSISVYLDERIAFTELRLPFIYLSQPDGAKTVLATVAGSMLSVASLTFSIVMVVLTMASSQFGPRILGNFMRDRGNQFVLGAFISTFLYCLLILRVVRGGGDVVEGIFVPQLSITLALVFTVINLAAFIYFIHHTTESVQVTSVIGKLHKDLKRKITKEFPEETKFAHEHSFDIQAVNQDLEKTYGDNVAHLKNAKGGYLRAFDEEGLLELAKEKDMVLKLNCAPGAYIMEGANLLDVYPGSKLDDTRDELKNKFVFGSARTPEQDLEFLFDQLLEIGLRALSPGVNDPITATMCIDRIADNLNLLAQRDLSDLQKYDAEGNLRVIFPGMNVSILLYELFAPIRSYGKGDLMVMSHLYRTLQYMKGQSNDPVFRGEVDKELERLKEDAEANMLPADFEHLLEGHTLKTFD